MNFERCRIGFLNPWHQKAENQAFQSLNIAAQRLGHELVLVTNSDEILEADLDFVLAVHPNQPKTTDVPTFGVIHSPRALLLEHDYYSQNLLTYDGYLTIMDTIERFLKSLCAGAGKPAHVGIFYNSPQHQLLQTDLDTLIESRKLRLCYFGTNWDTRAKPLFEALARRDYMRIYGPAGAWDYLNGVGYYGAVPFDGQSVQETYASFGSGLVVLSAQHALDDVISNRIFEITSVGAVAICPDIPWIRKHFGDSVLYYPAIGDPETVAREIDLAMEQIVNQPGQTKEKANHARKIFESKFAAEVMLENAITYFYEWRQKGGKRTTPDAGPIIDVIVRVGGRPVTTILRAIKSINDQTEGCFRIIFVRYKQIDLREITDVSWDRIKHFDVVDRLGGNRAQTLTTGLKAVRNALFAVLDDDDFWLSGHMAGLLSQVAQCPRDRAYAFSGIIHVDEPAPDEVASSRERRRIASMARPSGHIFDIMGTFAPHSWLASSALIKFIDLDDWTLNTAEDTVLQANLISRAEPLFSYRATACSVRGSEGSSNYRDAPTRDEDVFECFARLYTILDRVEHKFPSPSMSNWSRLNWALQPVLKSKLPGLLGHISTLALEEGSIRSSIHNLEGLERNRIPLTPDRVSLAGKSRFLEEGEGAVVAVSPPPEAWAYGVLVRIDPSDFYAASHSIVVELGPVSDVVGVGLLNKTKNEFVTRVEAPASGLPTELWLTVTNPTVISALVIQNWSQASFSETQLRAVWVVRRGTVEVLHQNTGETRRDSPDVDDEKAHRPRRVGGGDYTSRPRVLSRFRYDNL